MPGRDVAVLRESAELFAALGDETRLRLLRRIGEDGPLSISVLTSGEGITRQAVTKHLENLEETGLIRGEQSGREKIWSLDERRLQIAQAYLERVSKQWDVRIHALKSLVEK